MSSSKTPAAPADLMEALVVMHESPGNTSTVDTLLRDIERSTGLRADSVVEYKHLHAFNVCAPRSFVEAIARAPAVQEIIEAKAESAALITPVAKRTVALEDALTLTGKAQPRSTRKGGR